MEESSGEEHAPFDSAEVRRRPRGKNLRRDEGGLPAEKVYAPRQRL